MTGGNMYNNFIWYLSYTTGSVLKLISCQSDMLISNVKVFKEFMQFLQNFKKLSVTSNQPQGIPWIFM